MIVSRRTALALLTIAAIVVVIVVLERQAPTQSGSGNMSIAITKTEKEGRYPKAKEFASIAGVINAEPFALKDIIGKKVVLLDFWTYSCINCQRTLPYLNAWQKKYADKGLMIIGIHTPEFEFEKDIENVRRAVAEYDITYPVVLDNDYATWRAYGNQYWPREYLIDSDGYIVHDHIGEGGYDETERAIQAALAEYNGRIGETKTITDDLVAPSDVGAVPEGVSPETYFGAARNEFLGNGPVGKRGGMSFDIPNTLAPNKLYLGGTWNVMDEYAESFGGATKIVYRATARDVFFVAGADASTTIVIRIDGKPVPPALRGRDVGENGTVTVKMPRLYRLIEGASKMTHTIELLIPQAGLRAFTFTFG